MNGFRCHDRRRRAYRAVTRPLNLRAAPLYSVFVAENVGQGWKYTALLSATPRLGAATLDLARFFSYVRSKGLATGDEYVASTEFGNEVITGAGETQLNAYSVSVE